jgi:hypothetical protein
LDLIATLHRKDCEHLKNECVLKLTYAIVPGEWWNYWIAISIILGSQPIYQPNAQSFRYLSSDLNNHSECIFIACCHGILDCFYRMSQKTPNRIEILELGNYPAKPTSA